MLVTEYMEGGDLLRNIAARRVSWYRRGRKVGGGRAVAGLGWAVAGLVLGVDWVGQAEQRA